MLFRHEFELEALAYLPYLQYDPLVERNGIPADLVAPDIRRKWHGSVVKMCSTRTLEVINNYITFYYIADDILGKTLHNQYGPAEIRYEDGRINCEFYRIGGVPWIRRDHPDKVYYCADGRVRYERYTIIRYDSDNSDRDSDEADDDDKIYYAGPWPLKTEGQEHTARSSAELRSLNTEGTEKDLKGYKELRYNEKVSFQGRDDTYIVSYIDPTGRMRIYVYPGGCVQIKNIGGSVMLF